MIHPVIYWIGEFDCYFGQGTLLEWVLTGKKGASSNLLVISLEVISHRYNIDCNKLAKGSNSSNGHVAIGYSFTNYFNQTFSVGLVFKLIKEVVIIPFLLCIIFPLGFSNIIKNSIGASLISGLTYGVIYALGLHVDLQSAIYYSITPALVVFSLTYLYKANNNIWSVYITYVLYVLFGTFAIGYLVR